VEKPSEDRIKEKGKIIIALLMVWKGKIMDKKKRETTT